MAPRATWKGTLKLGFLSCPVALYTAVGEGDEIHFNMVNRRTGHRLRRLFVDAETGEPVERDQQVKGYEVDTDRYVVLTEEEIEAAIPDSTKTIEIESFVPRDRVDRVAIDRPYYLAPTDAVGAEAFAVIRAACEKAGAVGIGRTVLFRRDRVVMLCPEGPGFLANLLHFEYEMRDEAQAFDDIPAMKITGEMLDLAKHIIGQKKGRFDPAKFEDRYETALMELIRAKQRGETIKPPAAPKRGQVIDLMAALRESAGVSAKPGRKSSAKSGKSSTKPKKSAAKGKAAPAARSTRRKAG
ncbi:non-homologous end joining protein Ku [Inquilinus limosus]|uniref:Non-homologous end joining protein Ku n=1 Tax=Inquilinus limosus MP06 TaxID=1398085 RepID=A0A0A0DEL3_9PROT|nr:Ku protein [Inquilinus limosus]KGM35412.1 DNA helicase [Inquilinus limosus MP06]